MLGVTGRCKESLANNIDVPLQARPEARGVRVEEDYVASANMTNIKLASVVCRVCAIFKSH